jgi:hypothetical protein
MKKVHYLLLIATVVLLTILLYKPKPCVTFVRTDIDIPDPVGYHNWAIDYGIEDSEALKYSRNSQSLRVIGVNYQCQNVSYFRDYSDIRCSYSSIDKLPSIIIGDHPAVAGISPTSLSPRETREISICFLIDAKYLSDSEILSIIAPIHVVLEGTSCGSKLLSNPILIGGRGIGHLVPSN